MTKSNTTADDTREESKESPLSQVEKVSKQISAKTAEIEEYQEKSATEVAALEDKIRELRAEIEAKRKAEVEQEIKDEETMSQHEFAKKLIWKAVQAKFPQQSDELKEKVVSNVFSVLEEAI